MQDNITEAQNRACVKLKDDLLPLLLKTIVVGLYVTTNCHGKCSRPVRRWSADETIKSPSCLHRIVKDFRVTREKTDQIEIT